MAASGADRLKNSFVQFLCTSNILILNVSNDIPNKFCVKYYQEYDRTSLEIVSKKTGYRYIHYFFFPHFPIIYVCVENSLTIDKKPIVPLVVIEVFFVFSPLNVLEFEIQ